MYLWNALVTDSNNIFTLIYFSVFNSTFFFVKFIFKKLFDSAKCQSSKIVALRIIIYEWVSCIGIMFNASAILSQAGIDTRLHKCMHSMNPFFHQFLCASVIVYCIRMVHWFVVMIMLYGECSTHVLRWKLWNLRDTEKREKKRTHIFPSILSPNMLKAKDAKQSTWNMMRQILRVNNE